MTIIRNGILLLPLSIGICLYSHAETVLPKLSPSVKDTEEAKITKEAAAEALITQTEEKALETLNAIIKKNKGKPNEPDLWLRRGELYMRRARSARFFEIQREDVEKAASFIPLVVRDQKSRSFLVEANRSYLKVFTDFKNHPKADQAIYTFAFNLEQLGEPDKAMIYYSRLTTQYPRSALIPDAYLALAEIQFNRMQFEKSLEHFNKVTSFKNSRAYWYAEYKKGWVYYNLRRNEQAMDQLVLVIKSAPIESNRISLRDEAIKDSTLFFSESRKPEEAYEFYSNLIKDENELVVTLIRLSDLYNRHSRYEDANLIYENVIAKHKKAEILARVLTKQANMFLINKAFIKSSQSLDRAIKACREIKMQSSECEIDVTNIQTQLIKNMWAQIKKNPNDKSARNELEKQIKTALISSISPETKHKFSSLLGDYYYESKRFSEAGDQYYFAFEQKPQEEATLLAAIDAMTQASQEDKKSNKKLITFIDRYTQNFPQSEKATELRVKKVAIHLHDKNPKMAKPELDLLMSHSTLNDTQKILVEDLYFDYLNQVQDYGSLILAAQKALKTSKTHERNQTLTKVIDEVTLKIAQDSIATSNTLAKRKDVIKTLGDLATTSTTLDKNNKRAAHLLAIREAYKNKLYLLALNLSQSFIEHYPEDIEVTDLRKSSLKLALDLGDLRTALRISMDLLVISKERDKSNLVKSILELQQVIGDQKDLQKFAESNLALLNEKDRAALFEYFWKNANQSRDTALIKWAEQKINQYNIEPLLSQIQLFQIESLLSQNKFEDAFLKSKKFMGSQYPKDIRARARLIQAKIFEKELRDIGRKTRMERLQLVLSIKTERLEKAQKAFAEVIQMSPSDPNVILEANLGLERTLSEYMNYLKELEVKNTTADETQQIKEALTQIGEPLKKKLDNIQKQIASLRKNQSVSPQASHNSTSPFEILAVEKTFEPFIGESVINVFPELIFDSDVKCKLSAEPNTLEFKACIARSKDLNQLIELLEQAQGYEFTKGEIAYLRSFEAGRNGRIKEAVFLLQLAISQNPSQVSFHYQLGRQLIIAGQIESGLGQLYQAYLRGMKLENLKLVAVIDGYHQNNCYKSLAFSDSVQNIANALTILSPIVSECFARIGDSKSALKILDAVSKPSSYHYIQYARIYEDYLDNIDLAEAYYGKALQNAAQSGMKVWLTKKISFLKSQAQSKKADRISSEGLNR